VVRGLLPEENFIEVRAATQDEYLDYFLEGTLCNVIASDQPVVSKLVVDRKGSHGLHEVGTRLYSKEPLAIVTRNDDPEWVDFVNWILQSLIEAEKRGITQKTAHGMHTTDVFGEKYKDMFVNAIGAVGNYGEIYSRHMEKVIPRQGLNLISTGTSGLLYSHPFGSPGEASHGREEGGTLDKVYERGYLKCGILVRSDSGRVSNETQTKSTFGKEFCYALSAATFQDYSEETKNKKTKIFIMNTTEGLDLINQDEVDVVSLVTVNLANDVTRKLSFSQPIYYDSEEGSLALATNQDDVQWSSFIYWTVNAIIYAEETNITKSSSSKMPLVNLFSPQHRLMMKRVIKEVGNYGDIFDRHVDNVGPRDGLNMLNSGSGPQLHPVPGIFN